MNAISTFIISLLLTCFIISFDSLSSSDKKISAQQIQLILHNDPANALIEINNLIERYEVEGVFSSDAFQIAILQIEAFTKLGQYGAAYQAIEQLEPRLAQIELIDAQAQFLFSHASLLLTQNKTLLAKEKLEKALLLSISEPLLEADIFDGLSLVYRAQANYLEAKLYSEKAIAIAEQLKDKRRIADYYNKLGVILDYMGLLEAALSAHETSLNTQRLLNNQQGISNSLYNIAELFRDLEDFNQSLAYFQQALQVDLSLGNPRHIANSYGKIGQVLFQQGHYAEAINHIEKGLKITRKMQADSDTAWQLSNLININLAQKNNDLALAHAQEALELALRSNAKRTERTVRLSLANTYITIGKLELAKTQLQIVLKEPQLGIQMQSEVHQKLSNIAEQQGLFSMALEHLQQYQVLQVELRTMSDERKALQMKMNVELAKKEQALMLLQRAKSLQQVQLDNLELQRELGIAIALLILAIIAIYFLRLRQLAKYKALEQRLAQESLRQKNKLLADISHDLRTPLTSLSLIVESLVFKVEPNPDAAYKKIERKVSELDNLITDIYQSAKFDNNVITVEARPIELNEIIATTCDELRPLFAKKNQALQFSSATDPVIVNADPNRLTQVILNLLRNSHFYTDSGGQCQVSLKLNDKNVLIIIEDSTPGVGVDKLSLIFERNYRCSSAKNKDKNGSGLGLAICKQVILAHGGQIKASNSTLGGLLIEVRLPLKLEEKA